MAIDASNATLPAGVDPSRARVAGAIKQAANTTGTSFEYLLTTAKMESDLNPTAEATTSSAHGLFQFIDQTWLGTVKEAGAQFGFAKYADAITRTASGRYAVDDPAMRRNILRLRDDPAAASAMAAALTQSNSFKLTGIIGRRPTDSELYMAHFMGVRGASRLINAAEDNPQASAVRLFPNAAAANRSIFYQRSGQERSVAEVYSALNARYARAANSKGTRSAMALLGDTSSSSMAVASTAAPVIDNAAYLSTFPDVRPVTPVTMASASNAPAPEPMFRTLFQGGERTDPLSPAVRELWGNSLSLASVTNSRPNVRPPQPLDLFSDRDGTFSG